MHCTLVSHTHWDREWYRTFQSFRARLVDAIDRVLVLVGEGKILGAGVEMGRADHWLALLRSDVVALSL